MLVIIFYFYFCKSFFLNKIKKPSFCFFQFLFMKLQWNVRGPRLRHKLALIVEIILPPTTPVSQQPQSQHRVYIQSTSDTKWPKENKQQAIQHLNRITCESFLFSVPTCFSTGSVHSPAEPRLSDPSYSALTEFKTEGTREFSYFLAERCLSWYQLRDGFPSSLTCTEELILFTELNQLREFILCSAAQRADMRRTSLKENCCMNCLVWRHSHNLPSRVMYTVYMGAQWPGIVSGPRCTLSMSRPQ